MCRRRSPASVAGGGALHERVEGPRTRGGGLRRAGLDTDGAASRGTLAHGGAVPVPRGAHALLRDRPAAEGLPLLRLRGLGRRVYVRAGNRGGGLPRGARAPGGALWGGAAARTGGPARAGAPAAPRAAAGAAEADGGLLRTISVGVERGGAGAGVSAGPGTESGAAARVQSGLLAERVGSGAERLAAGWLAEPRGIRRGTGAALAVGSDLRPLPLADHVPAVRHAWARAGV